MSRRGAQPGTPKRTAGLMRVLHLVNYVNESGNGITNVTVDLACEQSTLGHQVLVGSAGGAYEELLARHGVDCRRIDFTSRLPRALHQARLALRTLVHDAGPDVIHAHTLTAAVLASSLVAGP